MADGLTGPVSQSSVIQLTIDFMCYEPAQKDVARNCGGNPRWLVGKQGPSVVKLTFPMGVITSYVIVVGAQGLYYLWVLLRHTLSSSARKVSIAI
ncbi:hypothetical protein ElyMa_004698400 [Elysia marginata]|uniref:Uncharacterized protein n=1 Tax=Elysia marginata TaxID=1093978 RepID=A0AAV4I999_9GAST|nr:hypothetical protein ElyMa_004698400 [Elysia marginata]